MRISSVVDLVRPTPYDASTPEGRAQERNRRAILSMLASVGARSISMVSMLLLAPLALNYLGAERYGLWMTISAVTAMLSFADFGIGNGLLNVLSAAYGRTDTTAARQYVSSAYAMLGSVAVVIGLLFTLAYDFVDWARIFNVTSPQAAREAGPSIAVFVACFALSMPLGVVQRVQQGYQEGFIDSFWVAMGKITGLAGVVVAIALNLSLPWLIMAFSGLPVLALALNTAVLFARRKPWLRPHLGDVSWSFARDLLQVGTLFFVLQLSITFAFSSDNIIIAQIVGAEGVAEYSLARQLFLPFTVFLSAALGALWPAYREAATRGEFNWLQKAFTRSLVASISITAFGSALLFILNKDIYRIWLGSTIMPPQSTLLALGVWTIVSGVSLSLGMLLNGLQIIKLQIICNLMMTFVNLFISIYLTWKIGIPGVIWGSIISQTILVIIPSLFYVSRTLISLDLHTKQASPS